MPIRIAIAGLGSVGRTLARRLHAGMPGLVLAGVAARDHAKANAWLAAQGIACPVAWRSTRCRTMPTSRWNARRRDIIEQICRPMLSAGKRVMVLSAGALLPRPELIELAKKHGGQIIVPTGALLALDAVTAAAEGNIHSVTMVTRKPPNGLSGASYLREKQHFRRRAQ